MLKTSLILLTIALFALLAADIEVLTLDPWRELGRLTLGFFTPDFLAVWNFKEALLNTIVFAFCGTSLGILLGTILAFKFELTAVRLFAAFVRSIHEIFWVLLFLPVFGLNAFCGVLAIAVPYAGIFAKVYAEIIQESEARPRDLVPVGTSGVSLFFYAVLPVVWNDLKQYTAYRFECALRSSTVLGFIGLPTLGFHLETAFSEGLYSQAGALLLLFYLLVSSLRWWLKPKFVVLFSILSWSVLPLTTQFSWENMIRFFSWEIVPWPLRRDGFFAGTGEVSWNLNAVSEWFVKLLNEEIFWGVINTLILTQIALVGSAVIALVLFPTVSQHFSTKLLRQVSHLQLIVLRSTPEYLLAYIFILLWGPSMLPAIIAISLHNGAILAFLIGRHSNLINLCHGFPKRRLDRYFFEILPRIYGSFLAFLFYRWEVILRESAILGILGVATLGFYIDSGFAEEKLDVAFVLLLVTALLNLTVDHISQRTRKHLHLSNETSSI
ncbi:MAG: ABC transporter permease [SAR324 cluster bacterium]|nr:ABC transporter permease [SAR324 cluster bacterium]MBL7034330.1 ABC transporter permease [SAR324 cluster bacterium]